MVLVAVVVAVEADEVVAVVADEAVVVSVEVDVVVAVEVDADAVVVAGMFACCASSQSHSIIQRHGPWTSKSYRRAP